MPLLRLVVFCTRNPPPLWWRYFNNMYTDVTDTRKRGCLSYLYNVLGQLKDNYNGMGAIAPDKTVIDFADNFIRTIDLKNITGPELCPYGNGGLSLTLWSSSYQHTISLEFVINPDKTVKVFKCETDEPTEEKEFKWEDKDKILNCLMLLA